MTKKDLEYGMILETRDGKRYILHNRDDIGYNLCGEGMLCLDLYTTDLRPKLTYEEDIVKIYEDYTCQKVLWERKELSADEKTLLKCLPKEVKYIARDKEGELWCFETKPYKKGSIWDYKIEDGVEAYELNIFNHLFQSVKWEDEEPTLIADLIEGD